VEQVPGASVTLRPLGLGELLDRAVTVCVRNFWLLAAIYVGYAVLGELFQYFSGNERVAYFNALSEILKNPSNGAEVFRKLSQQPVPAWFGFGIAGLLLVAPLPAGALAAAASAIYLGRTLGVGGAYAVALRRWLQLLLLAITYAAVMFGALFLLTIALTFAFVFLFAGLAFLKMGGLAVGIALGLAVAVALLCLAIVVGLAYQLSVYTCVLENANFWRAFTTGLRRAFGGVGFRRTLVVGLAFWAIALGITIVDGLAQGVVLGIFHSAALSSVLGVVVSVATGAFGAVFIAFYYYDLRIREEGLDLQVAAAAMPVEAARLP